MDHTNPDARAGHNRDAHVTIRYSEDMLRAIADFSPPIGAGKLLTIEQLEKMLEVREIGTGVDWDRIKDALLACNTERKQQVNIIIAQGIPPVDEIPAHYELIPKLLSPQQPKEKGGRIDHKLSSPFIMVKKEQVLAKRFEYSPGEEGTGVTGGAVSFGKKEISAVQPGEGTYTDDDGNVRAAISGRFTKAGDVFTVLPILDVKGNVDYHTGHIIFPGDVVISGEIKSGFHVYAGGDLICNETLEAEDITAKKNVIAKLGIMGRGHGVVRAGESINAKFIQNCEIKSRTGVYVQDSILGSYVKTMGTFTMGDHGKILGGEILAIDGVTAARVGNEAYQHTYIQCGIDFVAKKELEKVKQKHIALYLKLQSVEEMVKEKKSSELSEVQVKLQAYIDQLSERMDQLLLQINKNEDAVITITDTIYPGTTLDICHTDYIVEKPMKRVRFRLDKKIGEIVVEDVA